MSVFEKSHVQPLLQKYFAFRKSENVFQLVYPALASEGVSRSSRHVARDAMDASVSPTSDIDAYGQAVWSCPLDAGVKFIEMIDERRWQQARFTGESME